jgi:carbamoyl-phosphate synthase large subunit
MGTGRTFGEAYIKAQNATGITIPQSGTVFISVRDPDKTTSLLKLAEFLANKEFKIIATDGTSSFLNNNNIQSSHINKVHEGKPHIVDLIRKGLIDLIINTTEGKQSIEESLSIRAEAVIRNVTYYTSLEAIIATMDSFDYFNIMNVTKIQDYYKVEVYR